MVRVVKFERFSYYEACYGTVVRTAVGGRACVVGIGGADVGADE